MVDYIKLCKEGGSRSYTELLKVPKLGSPFVEECFEQNVSYVEKWLDKVDDLAL
jgi:oligoendopeptidase F